MLQKYLRGESIEKTVRRFSQSPHPPGSAEGKTLAAEVLNTFKKLNLDHTWTDSHYARLQFPDRMKPNSLHVVDSAGRTVGDIALESSAVYCAYSATGSTTVLTTSAGLRCGTVGMCAELCCVIVLCCVV
ncbi:transferrin receptor protein 2 [Acipenser oxyrinchus oxyrinchus]|uniref:Transferrin receptor protein 2 n=1 Tax=Acipenser oxyrinchus oxyrinchus TaxID=40147 RepID=A0AAD8CDH1_ACIOX|nr:transferrin receptor protein 2 [Acipenser oxyrinchus oxyrinchus]